MAYNLSFIIKSKGIIKVTCSNVHFKSSSISETVIDIDVVTTNH